MRSNHLLPFLLLGLAAAPAQPLPRTLARPHPHTHPSPPQPAYIPTPTSAPAPTYTADPILIATTLASALTAGTLGWFLATLRHRRLLTTLTAQLADATHHRHFAETSLQTLKTETSQQKSHRRETWLLAQAEREQADVASTANQLRFVAEATLLPARLLGREEQIVFRAALRAIQAANQALRTNRYALAPQVSMGEFLRSSPERDGPQVAARAYSSISCKRSDLLIYTRPDFLPALVIEHQGSGHYLGNARERDAVKRAALVRADIHLLETTSTDPATLLQQITEKLASIAPTPENPGDRSPSRT